MLNDEIHAAREVAKTSTQRLQTFRTPDFGALGQADADGVNIYRHPVRRRAPDTEFDVRGADASELPRVDVSLSYAGADGADIDAYVAAGAEGIVVAGFAPGLNTKGQVAAIERAHEQGRDSRPVEPGGKRPGAPARWRPAASRPRRRGQPHSRGRRASSSCWRSGKPRDRDELRRMFETY